MFVNRVAASCSYYGSVGTVSSYTTYYAIYTSCGFLGWSRCRAGLVINSLILIYIYTVLDLIQHIIQHIMHKNIVVQVMDHFLIVHVSQCITIICKINISYSNMYSIMWSKYGMHSS